MSVRGIIFDLDGTLIDSNRSHVEAWRRAFAGLGYPVPTATIAKLVGMGGDKLVPAAVGEAADWRHGDDLRAAHGREYEGVLAEQPVRLFPGAVELLREAGRMGVKTALATSSKQAHLDISFGSVGHDLADEVDEVATADDAAASKPEPDLIHAAAGKLGLDPAECVLVGDTPYDGQAAVTAGACFWAVQCGGFDAGELWGAGADRVFADPDALRRHLDDLLVPVMCVQAAMKSAG